MVTAVTVTVSCLSSKGEILRHAWEKTKGKKGKY